MDRPEACTCANSGASPLRKRAASLRAGLDALVVCPSPAEHNLVMREKGPVKLDVIVQRARTRTPALAPSGRRLGLAAAVACVLVIMTYGGVLIAGLCALPSPQVPIGDPFFTILEILIIVLTLPLVALMSVVHAWAPQQAKVYSSMALVFIGLLAGVTACVHFVILTVGHASGADQDMAFLFSFTWPSVVYALDILAWDVFFALAVLCAAVVFSGGGLLRLIRVLLLLSGTMALVGLVSVVVGDMRWRFIGIAGYVLVFPLAVTCIGVLFFRVPTVIAAVQSVTAGDTSPTGSL